MPCAFEPTAFEPTAFYVGGATTSPAYARMLWALLPPGRVWRRASGLLFKVFEACADELARVDARVINLTDEADPRTALELLDEYEAQFDLDEAATVAERRARIVARTIARQRYRPADFITALEPLLGEGTAVLETSHADALAIEDVREIYRFFIYRNPTDPGTYYVDSAQEVVDLIKPSHTLGYVIESFGALYDDAYSLYDRDIMEGTSAPYDDGTMLYDVDVYGA